MVHIQQHGGCIAVTAHSLRRSASTSHFPMVVRTFTTVTDRGQHYTILLAVHHRHPRALSTLNASQGCSYIGRSARHVPGSMPNFQGR